MNDDRPLFGRPRGRFPLSPQGWPFVLGALLAWLLCWWLQWTMTSMALLLLLAFVVNFFRDPEREIPRDEAAFLSPADGRVIRAERREGHLRVDIFMNVFNVHVNRAPMSGQITDMCYTRGSFVNASYDEASEQNERNRFTLRNEKGEILSFTQISGLLARRIVSYVRPGETVRAGQRIGMIRFGSRVDCQIPPDFELNVQVGDKVQAGCTVLARRKQAERDD